MSLRPLTRPFDRQSDEPREGPLLPRRPHSHITLLAQVVISVQPGEKRVLRPFGIADRLDDPPVSDQTAVDILDLVEQSAPDGDLRSNPRLDPRDATLDGFAERDELVHLNFGF